MLTFVALASAALLLPAEPAARPDTIRADGEIREYVLRHVGEVRHCYQNEGLKRDPQLAGLVEVTLTIAPTGVVDTVEVDAKQLAGDGNAAVADCIMRVARNWRFARGPYDVEVHILPFALAPVEGHAVRESMRTAERRPLRRSS